jgi:hypothetical protein
MITGQKMQFLPYYVIAEKNFSAYTRSTTGIYNLFNRYECEFHKQVPKRKLINNFRKVCRIMF